jgi:hypothetical protein
VLLLLDEDDQDVDELLLDQCEDDDELPDDREEEEDELERKGLTWPHKCAEPPVRRAS